MPGKHLHLRCKTKDGNMVIDSLTEESTIEELKAVLFSCTGISPHRLKVLRGYPPSLVDLSNDHQKLSNVLSQPREMLIVEEYADKCETNNHFKRVELNAATATVKSTNIVKQDTIKSPPQSSSSSTLLNLIRDNNGPRHTDSKPTSQPGLLMRREVPANNSCLFTSIYFCLSGGEYNESAGCDLRKIIADIVSSDLDTYNEAFLGKPNADYCKWILNQDHWGGGIEISILSKYYSIEIVAVDTQNIRLNRFGEDKSYDRRILLIYDGIHYDPLMLEPFSSDSQHQLPVQTIFPTSDESILNMALQVAREAKASRQFTDVQNFSLRCLVCSAGLRGQAGARQHAKETGHINFGEI